MNHSPASIRSLILERLHQIAPEADLESLSDSVDLRRELEIDSFDFLQLLIFLNERLGVEFPEADYGGLTTIQSLTTFIGKGLSTANQTEGD